MWMLVFSVSSTPTWCCVVILCDCCLRVFFNKDLRSCVQLKWYTAVALKGIFYNAQGILCVYTTFLAAEILTILIQLNARSSWILKLRMWLHALSSNSKCATKENTKNMDLHFLPSRFCSVQELSNWKTVGQAIKDQHYFSILPSASSDRLYL